MPAVLVDSNVLLDVLTKDRAWFEWSSRALEMAAESSVLVVNPIVYAEVSVRFETIEELEDALPGSLFRREALPWEGAFLAAHSRAHLSGLRAVGTAAAAWRLSGRSSTLREWIGKRLQPGVAFIVHPPRELPVAFQTVGRAASRDATWSCRLTAR